MGRNKMKVIKKLLFNYRMTKATKYWNDSEALIKKNIEDFKNDENIFFKWDQLVWQEIWMFIKLHKQVTNEEILWLVNRRGYNKVQHKFLIEIMRHVGLGKKLTMENIYE
jgi:hypothetical protein